jgi:hypothetical protein
MAAQKATELRRLCADVEADQIALRSRQDALEAMLIAVPASTWSEAVEKARYLLGLFARTPDAEDPRRQRLIANVLDDFNRLLGDPAPEPLPVEGGEIKPTPNLRLEEEPMAKAQKRGNRETKKPKQIKPDKAPVSSPFAVTAAKASGSPKPGGKK